MDERTTGIAEGTFVHTSQGARPAHEMVVGDKVWSFDHQSCRWRLASIRILAVQLVKAKMSCLQVCGTLLRLNCYQLVWADKSPCPSLRFGWGIEGEPAAGSWVHASKLCPGDRVLSLGGPLVVERNVLQESETVCIAELELGDLHNYAVGPDGILVHNRNPALVAGQTHNLTVQATQAQQALILPPIDQDHILRGVLRPGPPVMLDGLHHVRGGFSIQQGMPIIISGHTMMEMNTAGVLVPRIVTLRTTPWHTASADAPFDARVEALDPGSNMVLGRKNRSTFFPLNWTWAQVVQAIYEALVGYVETKGLQPIGAGLRTKTDAGVKMSLRVSGPAGIPTRILSGYPLGAQPLVTAAQAPQ